MDRNDLRDRHHIQDTDLGCERYGEGQAMSKFPDIFSRCLCLDGSIDLKRLKRLSREAQIEHESLHSRYSVMETAMYEILSLVGKRERATGIVRDTNWVITRATKAIAEVSQNESRGFIELQQMAQLTHQPINQ